MSSIHYRSSAGIASIALALAACSSNGSSTGQDTSTVTGNDTPAGTGASATTGGSTSSTGGSSTPGGGAAGSTSTPGSTTPEPTSTAPTPEPTSTAPPSSTTPTETGVPCGSVTCAVDEECCNESCGICTPPGGFCTQQFCGPVPAGCQSAADCRLFSDYCTGCDCRALAPDDPDPTCSGPGVRCFADPCEGSTAECVDGECFVQAPAPSR